MRSEGLIGGPLSFSSWLPQENCPITAMAFNALGTEVAVANSSNHLCVYHVDSRRPTPWSKTLVRHSAAGLSACAPRCD